MPLLNFVSLFFTLYVRITVLCFFLLDITYSVAKNESHKPGILRVLNGWPAKLGDVPYQLAFKRRQEMNYITICGGVLIAPDKLLSAAHCFEENERKYPGQCSKAHLATIIVVAGNLYNIWVLQPDSLYAGQWRLLKSMVYPPRYKFPHYDISVGFTDRPFVLNAFVAPIPFTTQYANYRGTCLVSGFGMVSHSHMSQILLWAHLTVMPHFCSRMHEISMAMFLCADDYFTDIGMGDSGGPLVCSSTGDPKEGPRGILVGIVSGKEIGVGSFFTRVSSYTRFINQGSSSKTILIWFCLLYGSCVLFLLCFV